MRHLVNNMTNRFRWSATGGSLALAASLAIALYGLEIESAQAQQATGSRQGSGTPDATLGTLALEQPVLPASTPNRVAQAQYAMDEGIVNTGDLLPDYCDAGVGLGWWGSAEYLLWWERGLKLPPLISTSTPGDTLPNFENAGVLGFARTQVLFGGKEMDDNPLSGFRLTLGAWLVGQQRGIGGRYFDAGDRDLQFQGDQISFDVLARPFFNTLIDDEDSQLIAYPGEFSGSVDARVTGNIRGWDLFLRSLSQTGCNYRVDYTLGFRQLTIDDTVEINDSREFINPADISFGRVVRQRDFFHTQNEFNGVDFGLMGESQQGCWSLDFLLKIAVGNMRERITIDGSRVTETPGLDDVTDVGGLLTQPSNIGTYVVDKAAWIPEANINLGYALTPNIDLTAGYSFLYITDVINPSSVIDREVNLSQAVDMTTIGETRPVFTPSQRDYWLQGLNFGVSYRF